jgi:NAD(P)-dependent dehydrogenase (short-subunit alcohol dehydrogenase family)
MTSDDSLGLPGGEVFAGRVALVTGGAGGIGSAVVNALREQGARVVAADYRHAGADNAAPDQPGTVIGLDVTSKQVIADLVARIERQLGPIALLVNVAGVVSFGSAQDLAEEEWDRVIDINLKGTFLACQAVMASMKTHRFGRIVNIGSVVGKNGGNARPWLAPQEQQRAGNVAYGASKAGVHMLTSFLAKELAAFGVTVNAVAPGPIATGMTDSFPPALQALIPVGRMGSMRDVVRAILFLLAPDAGFITGEVLDVNGGIWCD